MKWTKFKEPYRAELIRKVELESGGKVIASANKDNPISGLVTHYGFKKIGANSVKMYMFWPDAAPDKCWEFSSKWFSEIRRAVKEGGANE